MNDDKVKEKMSQNDKDALSKKVEETISWISTHQSEEAEVYQQKLKEVEAISHPIMQRFYQSGGQMPNMGNFNPGQGAGTSAAGGPNVDEVD